jgi:hypothetical protein
VLDAISRASPARDARTRLFPVLGVLLLGVVPTLPALVAGTFPSTHEELRYPALLAHFLAAQSAGVAFPQWLPDLAGGYGYPIFVFYQPLFFHLAALVSRVTGLGPALSACATVQLASIASAAGAYLLARRVARPVPAMLAAALFMLTPYLYVNLYVRGDLSETLAMLATPWPLLFLWRMQERAAAGRPGAFGPAVGLGVGLAALVLAHPATGVLFFGVFSVLGAGFTAAVPSGAARRRFLVALGLAIVLGLALSAPYWGGVLEMRRYVTLDVGGYLSAERHVVYPQQLFSTFWGYGIPSLDDASDGMSYQLGAVHALAAVAGAILGRRDRRIVAAFAAYLAAVAIMLPWSRPLWREILPLRLVQFPWRMLSVTAGLQLLCLLGIARRPGPGPTAALAGLGLAVLAANHAQFAENPRTDPAVFAWSRVERAVSAMIRIDFESFDTYLAPGQFQPRTAVLPLAALRRPDEPLVRLDHGDVRPLPGNDAHAIAEEIVTDQPTRVILRQYYLPGWRVEVDGRAIARADLEAGLTKKGMPAFEVPSGSHSIRARYEGTPQGRWRLALSMLVVAACLVLLRRHDRA